MLEEIFVNFPVVNFAKEENRKAMKDALKKINSEINGPPCGKMHYGLKVGNEWVSTKDVIKSTNPSAYLETLGTVSKGEKLDTISAILEAQRAKKKWRRTSVEERADYLFNVAEQMEKDVFDLSSLLVYEAGKNWREAHADVAEAIDFLNFYGVEMKKLGQDKLTQNILGEDNTVNYLPKGVVGVISPWNFPLAILTGMTSAALVTGNTVVMKPATDTPLIAGKLMEMFDKAGLPSGVLNYVPGSGRDVGQVLVENPNVNMIAFTGSREVGLGINQEIAKMHSGQNYVKTCILEMGGKNGLIIDSTADFDEAIPGVLYSAFGYQGQKCSACSRLIVLDSVYDKFVSKLEESVKKLKVGPTHLPRTDVGAMINRAAYQNILDYLKKGKEQGAKFLTELVFDDNLGYFINPVLAEVERDNVLAREELFGPVLSILKVKDFDEAMDVLNETDYALTGGLYSRTPSHIEQFKMDAMVGNRYINRGTTGAVVERQPFGGFKMSGAGSSKAGCRDYLLEFMYPTTTSINTSRSGHIPGIEAFIDSLK